MRAEWLPVQLTLREAQALRLAATYALTRGLRPMQKEVRHAIDRINRAERHKTPRLARTEERRRRRTISGKENAPGMVKIDPSAEKVSCWLVWALSHTGHTVLQAARLTKTIAGRYHRVLRG